MDNLQPKQSGARTALFVEGAQWVRADLHLHTRADREFKYAGDDNYYNSNYVEALEKAQIRLGVITNHNKFDFEEFKALRKTALKKGIALLPGVELSVNDGANGIHTLVVFSDEWIDEHNYINPFLTSAFEGKAPAEYEQENGRTSWSLLETIKKLEGYHRDFFLVFAHVEAPSGLWAELDGGRLSELGQNEFFRRRTLGFQKVRTHDGAGKDKPSRTKVQGWLQNWYPAELEGSDPKCIDEIGRGKTCYLKLGELSFEAVKFALSDPASRVAPEPPKHQASHIRSIHFDGGILDGQTLHFSPGLNTLIGIRGSGKSSILEAVRYALDIPRGEKAQDTKYKDELIRHTLGSGGKVTLTACDVYGQEFTISRIFREAPNVYLNGKLQPGVSIRETVLRRPIYFGQKDLSSTGEGFETDLVEKLVGEKLRALRDDIEAQRQRVREAAQRWLKLSTTAEQKRDYEAQLTDANFRLKKFEEYGVADKLQKRLGFQQDAAALTRLNERATNFILALGSLIAEHEDELRNAMSHVSRQNPEFFSAYYAEFSHLIAKVEQLKQIEQDARTIAGRLHTKQGEFEGARKSLQEEFAQVERQLAQELKQTGMTAIQPDDFLTQQQRKTKAEQMLEALTKQESQQTSIRDALFAEIDKLNELWLREFSTIKAELDRVNASHTALQIEADFKGDKEAAIGFMQQLFKGSNIRETTLRAVMEDYADFGGLLRALPGALAKAGSTPEVFEKTLMQNLSEFVTWQVPNRFVIRYRGKELKHHSLGQRASALLLYVLSQRQNDVIIIDQPEDDLDNQTIYEDVIKLIRELKPHTQFIFATHNANFPVLGDAEQVHACQYQDEKVSTLSGSIDARPVQKAIINIMEGGQDAFDRRKEIYNLWKSQS
ncbi:TrlF family AAA-like ATPase [Pseudomonas aeruginosa]|uniref:TrlF family AAA-like ATPase n=1 Tax=Pseudomonas aeruginosa TaxID=287 RepID=UPI001BD3690D|nr:AAA family ATPase [Pseudomonas aeruginosa]EKS2409814.1 histidinol-phosphatase [Pseudomonas aeruginosa]MBS9757436.1 histidinol-phosphatase [Pseudomonas aeruginosa]HCG0246794.1 histidinol-phosphatase [Pseudomonas aeruginosa]HCG0266466.1 histidinol-phosphatase [Pseudomonas aeruginosa]HCG0273124.1 histidinol-phosphatase [Pseudomonas aeruginosa]